MTKVRHAKEVSHASHAGQAKRYEMVFLNDKASLALAKNIKHPERTREVQLAFKQGVGHLSPKGEPLQLVNLSESGSIMAKSYSIAYIDYKAKQFWAQPPGVSGRARGPFELPKGFKAEAMPAPTKQSANRDTFARTSGSESDWAAVREQIDRVTSRREEPFWIRGGE